MFESLVSASALFVRERAATGKWFVGRRCMTYCTAKAINVLTQYRFLTVDEYNVKILYQY